MRVADAAQMAGAQHVIVTQDGRLLGQVPNRAVTEARPDLKLQDISDDPVFLSPKDLNHAADLINHHQGKALPVVDDRDRIVETVTASDLAHRPLL